MIVLKIGEKNKNVISLNILSWPKSSFGFFHKRLQKNPNNLLANPIIYKIFHEYKFKLNTIKFEVLHIFNTLVNQKFFI